MQGPRKRSVCIHGHRTSFSLEDAFFEALSDIASEREISVSRLIAEIDADRIEGCNLSSALRLYVFYWLKGRANTPASDENSTIKV